MLFTIFSTQMHVRGAREAEINVSLSIHRVLWRDMYVEVFLILLLRDPVTSLGQSIDEIISLTTRQISLFPCEIAQYMRNSSADIPVNRSTHSSFSLEPSGDLASLPDEPQSLRL